MSHDSKELLDRVRAARELLHANRPRPAFVPACKPAFKPACISVEDADLSLRDITAQDLNQLLKDIEVHLKQGGG